jgi:hypothetical protein
MAQITDLLLVQQKLRDCLAKSELGYVIVNDSEKIVDYQSSVFWVDEGINGKVQSVSGLPEPIKHIPFTVFMQDICRYFHKSLTEDTATPIDVSSLSEERQQQWREFLPEQAVWLRLTASGKSVGGLLLARTAVFEKEELGLLAYWGGAVGHAVNALWFKEAVKPSFWASLLEKKMLWIIAAVIFLICWIPVSLSVNAAGEVVPQNPLVERSPIDGIVGEVFVQPNQLVSRGDLVMTFDDTAIKSELDVVKQELAIAQAEYQRANQAAVFDRDTSSQMPMLKARVEQQEAQVSYSESVLERSRVYAERDGIIIIQIESELEGRPVQVGERLFTLAEAGRSELEFWLAVGDSIPLPTDADVQLFLNVHPDRSYGATVRFVSYQAEVSPDGILGYRGRADLINGADLLVGWRGTAKIYGESVPLIYLVLRRPLAVMRQWLGL